MTKPEESTEVKLLPCSFCGGGAEFFRDILIGIMVYCTKCGASSPIFESEIDDEARTAWNQRSKKAEDTKSCKRCGKQVSGIHTCCVVEAASVDREKLDALIKAHAIVNSHKSDDIPPLAMVEMLDALDEFLEQERAKK